MASPPPLFAMWPQALARGCPFRLRAQEASRSGRLWSPMPLDQQPLDLRAKHATPARRATHNTLDDAHPVATYPEEPGPMLGTNQHGAVPRGTNAQSHVQTTLSCRGRASRGETLLASATHRTFNSEGPAKVQQKTSVSYPVEDASDSNATYCNGDGGEPSSNGATPK